MYTEDLITKEFKKVLSIFNIRKVKWKNGCKYRNLRIWTRTGRKTANSSLENRNM